MKKHKVISLAIVMSLLALPVITLTKEADEKAVVAAVTKQKKAKREKAEKKEMQQGHMHVKTGKDQMKHIERELDQIRKSFEANHDAVVAERKLKTMPGKIRKAVALMQKGEEHGTMWKRHEHRLNKKLQEVRDIINRDVAHRKQSV